MKSMLPLLTALFLLPATASAAGLTQHQLMADLAAKLATHPELSACLALEPAAHRLGGSFPDTGYFTGHGELGDVAHNRTFVNALLEEIIFTYPGPSDEDCALPAFLLGVASHVADDNPYHDGLIATSAEEDFRGHYEIAHGFCDGGLEFPAIVEFGLWRTTPDYYLPLTELEAVYGSLGYQEVADPLVHGTRIIIALGFLERWLAPVLYPVAQSVMPWTVENYVTWPEGGLQNGGELAAAYEAELWQALSAGRTLRSQPQAPFYTPDRPAALETALAGLAQEALEKGVLAMDERWDEAGGLHLSSPRVVKPAAWKQLTARAQRTFLQRLPR